MGFVVSNILDLVKESGEESVKEYVSLFSCDREMEGGRIPLNPDIEKFLKENAIQFARQKISVSYLVLDEDDGEILGYFTIAHKALELPSMGLSNGVRRKMERYSQHNQAMDSYTISAFLIAQFGKNYAVDNGKRIRGKELMQYVYDELFEIQHRMGGGIIYLDCEADASLISFYENENFRLFGERISDKDNKRYLQYMKFF